MLINFLKSKNFEYELEDWFIYFKNNLPLIVDFSEDKLMNKATIKEISQSIASFAKGESSDGKNLKNAIYNEKDYRSKELYCQIMYLFIKEENIHSFYLKKFMKQHSIYEKDKGTLDSIFRFLRKFGGIKGQLIVLSTAEIIALSYYQALAKAVDQPSMYKIAQRMLDDEVNHLILHTLKFSKIKYGIFTRFKRKIIMFCTVLAVWIAYKNLFSLGSYSFGMLYDEAFEHLSQTEQLIDRHKRERKIKYDKERNSGQNK